MVANPHFELGSARVEATTDASNAFLSDYHATAYRAPARGDYSIAAAASAPTDIPIAPAGVSDAAWSQISQWVASDRPVNITTAGSGQVPDYVLGSDGQLTRNPAKTTPNPDGSITVQVGNQADAASLEAAKQLKIGVIQEKIYYWQKAHPNETDVPDFLRGMLAAAQSEPIAPAAPAQAPERPAPVAQPQADVPQSYGPAAGYGGSPGGEQVGSRDVGSAPTGGYRQGNFEPNGPIDRTAIPRPVPGDLNIKGPPSANPEQIQTFLEKMGSPAAKEAGFSQALYTACTDRGIDPAVAVGFFLQESTCGRYGRGHENHSMGNIKGTAPESGGSDGTFRHYNTWAEGARDWARLIDENYVQKRGLNTLSQVISVYAPGSDNNNERGYVATVKGVVENFKKQGNQTALA